MVEKSAGAVIFRKEGDKIYYLLLHYQSRPARNASLSDVGGHWDFPKGNIEKGEKLEETVKREVKEETGIGEIKFIPEFKEVIKYFYKKRGDLNSHTIFKTVTFFLAETKTKEVKISWEHVDYKWLPCQQALEQLIFKNAKEILKKAHKFLHKVIEAE